MEVLRCGTERMPSGASLEAALAGAVAALRGTKSVTLVLNDPQRQTPTEVVLAGLRQALSGVRVQAVIATGTHRFASRARRQFERVLRAGAPLEAIAWHDCRSAALVELAGPRPWRCHPWLAQGDGPVLGIGSCEPHYFAGVTGAHKTVTIGCASFEDVQANHAGAMSWEVRPGRLAGNRVHEDIAAMLATIQARRRVLAVNLLHKDGAILAAAFAPPLEALDRILPRVHAVYFLTIPSPADALVLEVPGVLGRSFYQADKAVKNNEWAVRDAGAIVLEAPCQDGVGQDDFLALLRTCPTYDACVAEVNRRGYRLGDHKGVRLRYLTDRRRVRVCLVSRGLAAPEAGLLGFTRADSREAALASAGVDPARDKVYVVPDAANTCVAVAGGDAPR